jgi:hypothetical protein
VYPLNPVVTTVPRQNVWRDKTSRDITSGDITSGDMTSRHIEVGDRTSVGQNVRRDKTYGGTKRPEEQNVRRDKKSKTKRPEGQMSSGTKRPEDQTFVETKRPDIHIKDVRRDKTSGDKTSFWINFNVQYLHIKNYNNNILLNSFQVYYSPSLESHYYSP